MFRLWCWLLVHSLFWLVLFLLMSVFWCFFFLLVWWWLWLLLLLLLLLLLICCYHCCGWMWLCECHMFVEDMWWGWLVGRERESGDGDEECGVSVVGVTRISGHNVWESNNICVYAHMGGGEAQCCWNQPRCKTFAVFRAVVGGCGMVVKKISILCISWQLIQLHKVKSQCSHGAYEQELSPSPLLSTNTKTIAAEQPFVWRDVCGKCTKLLIITMGYGLSLPNHLYRELSMISIWSVVVFQHWWWGGGFLRENWWWQDFSFANFISECLGSNLHAVVKIIHGQFSMVIMRVWRCLWPERFDFRLFLLEVMGDGGDEDVKKDGWCVKMGYMLWVEWMIKWCHGCVQMIGEGRHNSPCKFELRKKRGVLVFSCLTTTVVQFPQFDI